MSEQIKIQVYRRHHNGRDKDGRVVRYKPGDTFTGTEALIRKFGDRLRRVEEDKPKPKRQQKPKPEPEADMTPEIEGDAKA